MKVSYNALNTFFDGKLPPPDAVLEALMFHAWEIEEVIEKDGDTVLDVKVLPDKSAWALSHRGIAKDLSVILSIPLRRDPLREISDLSLRAKGLSIEIHTDRCARYIGAYITGVTVGPSPEWLQQYLRALGQRSINNVVDITNYVMLQFGQPLHAFDAKKLSALKIGVRQATEGEKIVTLTGEEYALSPEDTVIVDGGNDALLGIAGIKGGKVAEIDAQTTDIIIESAHFDRVAVRKTSQRLRLRTDASMRFENGVVPAMAAYAIRDVVASVLKEAGGALVGYADAGEEPVPRQKVSVSLSNINSVLGVSLSAADVEAIFLRFGYEHAWSGEVLTVEPPCERPDLIIPEDLIEEIGRIYGYEHVASVVPEKAALVEVNKTFYYTDLVRNALLDAGFSEVFTSSFRDKDEVKLKNALASDKGYLRSALTPNMHEVLVRNAPHTDLLGVREIRAFEVGTVFTKNGQYLSLALGVSSPQGYKAKSDDRILALGMERAEKALGTSLAWTKVNGVAEAVLSGALETLPMPSAYAPLTKTPNITYKPFSPYPFASRDVAFWVPQENALPAGRAPKEYLREMIVRAAGALLVRLDLFDTFSKDGRTSYAFRLIFQSYDKTLTEEDLVRAMDSVYAALKESGCEIR